MSNGQVLDVNGGSTQAGSGVIYWSEKEAENDNQTWVFTPVSTEPEVDAEPEVSTEPEVDTNPKPSDDTVLNPSDNDEESEGASVTVTDTPGGKTRVNSTMLQVGEQAIILTAPEQGHEVEAITVLDQGGNKVPVIDNGDGTWSYVQPAGGTTVTVTYRLAADLPFEDVSKDDWFYDHVMYVYQRGLMVGTSETTFSPNAATSRGMISVILWRLAGEPAADNQLSFTDVAVDAYYTEAIRWATSEGIVGGYGNGLFGPEDAITGEQLAVMLYRFAQYMGCDVSASTDLSGYADADEISHYALAAMEWANGEGLLYGMGDGTMAPQDTATRAQVDAIIQRFCQRFGSGESI